LVSRSKLQRDFRRVMGKTLKEAIMTARLERATQLLLETPWPLEKLARAAGFGTTRHFHRTFVQTKRITPIEYRRRFAVEMTRRPLSSTSKENLPDLRPTRQRAMHTSL